MNVKVINVKAIFIKVDAYLIYTIACHKSIEIIKHDLNILKVIKLFQLNYNFIKIHYVITKN